MVNKCSAYGCKIGYTSSSRQSDLQNKVSCTFSFFITMMSVKMDKSYLSQGVRAEHQLSYLFTAFPAQWLRGWVAGLKSKSTQSRWCSDLTTPSIIPNAPSYMSTVQSQRRTTTKTTSACRHEQETTQLQQLEQSFIAIATTFQTYRCQKLQTNCEVNLYHHC